MPKYTLMHGGLKIGSKHYAAGSEVELSTDEADRLNRRGPHVKLTAVLKAEAEAEKKKAEAIAAAEKKAQADAEAEAKKHAKGGAQ